ncbi:AraC family transcriptional regulator [Pedobacter yulinensis]|uniref:AraC family transcriptional regulator n=1 Tax=Pedobacter yulinensis TaxID=2126353 RepID=A0A2T3HPC0_9SPHI|nr:AraC family transcriptional regulator [Pedobacter yulinensis]PST84310.1 AraC family transcriptional regulator [Pedobacter yulinensis]
MYQVIPPCMELRDHVSHFWFASWTAQQDRVQPVYYQTASCLAELAFAFRSSELVFASVQGHSPHAARYNAGGFLSIFGVSVFAYSLPLLFDVPPAALSGRFCTPEQLLGREGALLVEQVAGEADLPARVRCLNDFLKLRLRKAAEGDHRIIAAARQVMKPEVKFDLSAFAGECCLSPKQFERRFSACTGFSPKLFDRVSRFEYLLNNHRRFTTLTQAALASGYYDQSHFIRDFKQFAGCSPQRFFALSGY